MGVKAQEVEKVFPEVISEGPDGFKSVSYDHLIAPVIEAVKQLYGQVKALYERVLSNEKKTDTEIAALKEQIKLSNRTPASIDQSQEMKLMKEEMGKLKSENARKDQELKQVKAYLCHKDPSAPICN